MTTDGSRPRGERIVDLLIAAVVGGILGAVIVRWIPTDTLIVNRLHAKRIYVDGDTGVVSINGDNGINLERDDYAKALLWFHEPPNLGSSQQGGPFLFLANDTGPATDITPLGQETFTYDEEGKLQP